MSFDLHTHTTWSDGTTTPSENARLAGAAGLRGVALTDHDAVGGWPEMAAACARHGVEFVPGVELSTEETGRSIHVLGYWIDPDDGPLTDEMARLRTSRHDRAARMVEKLRRSGVEITLEAVLSHADGAPVGRSHVAAALVEAGAVPDAQAAFDRWIGDDRPAYVVKHAVTPEQGVALIIQAGGVAVLAHPGRSAVSEDLFDRLTDAGLAGVEADHPNHAEEIAVRWRRMARDRELLVTGSSDFHGVRKAVQIGERSTGDGMVDALRAQQKREPRAGHPVKQEVKSW
jgi:predicted metal-dependent phosphoesterase TrpH